MDGRRQQIDTAAEIVTPENIAFRYWLAGPARRAQAYAIDLLVQAAVLFCLFWTTGMATAVIGLAGSFLGLCLFAVFFVHWFYGGVLEAVWNGQTPGKWAMGLRVVTSEGQPIRAWQAVLRNLLRCVNAMPMAPLLFMVSGPEVPLFLVGLAAASLNNRFQQLGRPCRGHDGRRGEDPTGWPAY